MLEGQSTRETERTLASLSTQPVQAALVEQIKPLSGEFSKICFLAGQEFMAQLEEAKGLLAHQMPEARVSEILAEVMKLGLASLRKRKFKVRDEEIAGPKILESTVSGAETNEESLRLVKAVPATSPVSNKRYIPAELRRTVWLRDQGQCSAINPKTGEICGSKFKLDLDHIVPIARKGENSLSNIRLLCRACHVLQSVQCFGRDKMMKYLGHVQDKLDTSKGHV